MKDFSQLFFNIFQGKNVCLSLIFLFSISAFSQKKTNPSPEEKQSQNQLRHAQKSIKNDEFPQAEADYRKSISLDEKNHTARYNLGTAYYDKNKNEEARLRFQQAAKTAKTKEEKHRAFHNLGNTFMNAKKYQEAVESYKNALRNNPKDNETRYNLALAKELLEKNPPPPDDQNEDDDNQDQDQDQDQNQDQDSDNQDENEDENDDRDDQNENKSEPDQPEEDDSDAQQTPADQLSPEQIESLLEAMENEERKVQEKMNAEMQKGEKIESDKYW